jgi:hypothetical protein
MMNITFGPTTYRITAPESSWRQHEGLVWCNKCRDNLTFVFPCGDGANKVGFASAYMEPNGIRCRCFTTGESRRPPVPIERVAAEVPSQAPAIEQ